MLVSRDGGQLLRPRAGKGSALGPSSLVITVEAGRQRGTTSFLMQAARAPVMADLSFHGFCWGKVAFGMSRV